MEERLGISEARSNARDELLVFILVATGAWRLVR